MPDVVNSPEPTDARFSLRWLLVLMSAVSFLAAIGGAVLRQCSPPVRLRLTVFWAIWLTVVIGWTAFQMHRRKNAERKAGVTLLRLPMNGDAEVPYGLTLSAIGPCIMVVLTFALASSMVLTLHSSSTGGDWFFQIGLPLFVSLGSVSHFAPPLLWMREVRFCETGVLWDQHVLTWDRLISHRWKGKREPRLELFSVDSQRDVPWVSIPIAPVNRAAVQEVLDRERNRIGIPSTSARVGIGQVPITEFFKTSHMLLHTPALLASIISGGVLCFLGLFRETGVAEFDQVRLAGFYLVPIVGATWRWRGRTAGGGLVRVFARRDWLGFFATILLAYGIYKAATYRILPWGWMYYFAGVAFWYLAFRTLSYFFLTQLDLRAKGIVMMGGFYWPWAKVRLVRWEPSQSGRLVLARGLRRVVATVMPDQRDAVSQVLMEKLSYAAARSTALSWADSSDAV